MKTLALLLSAATAAFSQDLPKAAMDLFRTAAEALADKDAPAFLEKFDPKMPGYSTLHDEVLALLDHSDVSSVWEVVTDDGDDHQRTVDLDWILHVNEDQPRRQILKFRIERQGKKWKIVSLEPIEFFKPAALP